MNVKDAYIGIDLGTSSIKILLIDDCGDILGSRSEKYELICPKQGWKEIDQRIWVDTMVKGIRGLLLERQDIKVKSIGVSGQMHTLVIVDKKGEYIRPAIMWNDMRTKSLLPKLREAVGDFPDGEYIKRTISIGSPLANLLWMKENEPDNYRSIGKFMIAPDYLVYSLTGNYCTDYCCASTSCLYDIKNKKWIEGAVKLLELDVDVYPKVQGCAVIAGGLKKDMADRLGLDEGIPVLTATGDNTASGISTGSVTDDYPVISLGTSGVVIMHSDDKWTDKYGKRILFSFDGSRFHNLLQGTVQSNGSAISWWIEKILGEAGYECIDSLVKIEDEKDNDLLYYPHLAGEKTIYADPELRGAFIGLSDGMGKESLIYSLLEGICFGFRELSEKMNAKLKEIGCIKVVGGGSNSSVWMQIMANVLNVKLECLEGTFGPGYGIASLARQVYSKAENCNDMNCSSIKVSRCFEPQDEMVKICDRKYEMYKRIHSAYKYITMAKLPD